MNAISENQKVLSAVDILDTYFDGSSAKKFSEILNKILSEGAKTHNEKDIINTIHDMFVQVEIIVNEFNKS